jgi:hypothetical protein
MTNKDDMAQMKQFVLQLRDYGFNPSEDIVSDSEPLGLPDEDEMDVASSPDRRPSVRGTIIEFIKDEFENEMIANLSLDEWLEFNTIN